MYTIAVKSGIISSKYARNQFDLCPQKLLAYCDVNMELKWHSAKLWKQQHQAVKVFFNVIVQMVKNNVKNQHM